MIRKLVQGQFADGEDIPEETEGIILEEEDIRAILKSILDLSYDKKVDIFSCDQGVIKLAEELGVS